MPRPSQSKSSDGSSVARITLVCSIEQRRKIRMLAAQEDKSMNEFLLSLVEEKELHSILYRGFQESYDGKGREITAADFERWEKMIDES